MHALLVLVLPAVALLSIGCADAADTADMTDSPAGQLDFLAGEWSIHDPDGKQLGHSRVVLQVPGTMLFEQRQIGNRAPQPLWLANAERTGGWTQLFVTPTGLIREFPLLSPPGEWPLVMGASVTLRDGSEATFRMTISRASDDVTRRVLEMSRDAGESWRVIFDYAYRRIEVADADDGGCTS